MTKEIKLVLDRKMPGLNQVLHASKKEQAMMKREFTAYVSRELNKQGCVPDVTYSHIQINAVFYETQEGRDPDNLLVAFKYINDALICVGMVDDDSISQISFGSLNFKANAKKFGIVLTLECEEFETDF